jgi:lysophospholipase L1-like esterase
MIFFIISFLFTSFTSNINISTSANITDSSSKKLVLIGDSITKSFYGSLYIDNLSTMQYWVDLEITNSGIAGDSVRIYYENEHLVNHRVSQYEPDFVLVFLGLADTAWYSNVGTFETEYRWLINTIIQQNEDSQLLLVKYSWASTVITPFMESHVKVIEKIAREFKLPYSDVYKSTKGHEDWFTDGVHPNSVGAYQIALCLYDSFTGYINGSLQGPVNYSTSSLPHTTTNETGFKLSDPIWISGLIVLVTFNKKCREK